MTSPRALTATSAATTTPFGQADRGAADAALHGAREAVQLPHRRPGARADVALRRRPRREAVVAASRPHAASGRMRESPTPRSNRMAAGTIGTRARSDRKPMPSRSSQFTTPGGDVEAEGAAAGQHDGVHLLHGVQRVRGGRFRGCPEPRLGRRRRRPRRRGPRRRCSRSAARGGPRGRRAGLRRRSACRSSVGERTWRLGPEQSRSRAPAGRSPRLMRAHRRWYPARRLTGCVAAMDAGDGASTSSSTGSRCWKNTDAYRAALSSVRCDPSIVRRSGTSGATSGTPTASASICACVSETSRPGTSTKITRRARAPRPPP